jgi:hypothetical protein
VVGFAAASIPKLPELFENRSESRPAQLARGVFERDLHKQSPNRERGAQKQRREDNRVAGPRQRVESHPTLDCQVTILGDE